MNIDLVASTITAVASLLLAMFVYLKDKHSDTNKYFAGFLILIGAYSILNFLATHSDSSEMSFFWSKLVMISITPIGTIFYFFVSTFPNRKHLLNRKIKNFFYCLITIQIILISFNFVLTSVLIVGDSIKIVPGPAIFVFLLFHIGSIILASITLIKKFNNSTGIVKAQLQYITFGILISLGLTLFATAVLGILMGISTLIPISPLYLLVAAVSITYSIVRHRFLDIRLIVARAVTFILIIFFVAASYISAMLIVNIIVQNAIPSPNDLIFSIAFTLFATFTFQPLRRAIEKITDRFFYQDKYDSNDLLWKLNRRMASTLALSDLSQSMLIELLSAMKISHGTLVLVRNESIIWVDSHGNTNKHSFRGKDILTLIKASHKPKSRHEQILIFEEMPESTRDNLKKSMRENDITVVLPLVVRKELIGGLIFGEKSSGEIYSSEDIDLLKIMTPEIAISVKNALSYEEIRRFNITLEEEVKKATERLRHANIRLKELDQLKDEFVSIASHELRTPMTAIKSYLWLALNKPSQKIEEPLKKYLDISYKSTERLISLVNDMLTVSRIERNKIELKEEKVDIVVILNLIHDELKITADEKHIVFTLSFEEKGSYFVKGDNEKLREVFQNLIGNALKFTPEKGTIKIKVSTSGNNIAIMVSDTGSGIPKKEQSKLFQKFSKIEYSYSKHSSQPGSGLGLYISKQIVTLHKGVIEVQSTVGAGSVFTVRLPKYTSAVKQ